EDGGHAGTVERLLEAARSQERKDLPRLAFHRRLDGRVVEDRDPLLRAQARQRRFELERLVHRVVHEAFDRVLAPGLERAASEAAAEALDAREADALDLDALAVEHLHASVAEDLLDLGLVAGL